MEELRIKCPSCGIILDVKNSKNEAVKRITCPNCKKQLAVTFRDEPQSSQFVEIKMVQLADGSTKTIIRALTEDHEVKVNGQVLHKDDEVVLSVGDELQIDGKVSIFGKEGQAPKHVPSPQPVVKPTEYRIPDNLTPQSDHHWMPYVAIAIVVAIAFGGWYFYTHQQADIMVEKVEADTVVVEHTSASEVKPAVKPPKEQKQAKAKDEQPVNTNIASLSNYELEKLAMSGNVDAQCQLGKRWVNRHDSINVVKGLQYLKLAARNGSSEARSALRKVYAALEQSAVNGSTTAGNILREQR